MSQLTSPFISYQNGLLHIRKHSLSEIAKIHGTPLYVYDLVSLEKRLNDYRNALGSEVEIRYAMKANSHPAVLEMLKKSQMGVDAGSIGELKRALEAKFPPRKILYSGVGKKTSDLRFALEHHVELINVDSLGELERIGQIVSELNRSVSVLLRINPDVKAETHPYVATGFRENKFGVELDFLPQAVEILRRYGQRLNLEGLSLHIGSQLTDLTPLQLALGKLRKIFQELKMEGLDLKTLDVGGGLAISYHKEQKVPSFEDYGRLIHESTDDLSVQLICEPGRSLVGPIGLLLTEVQYIKLTQHKKFVIVDTGMNHLLRPALYRAYHEILPIHEEPNSQPKLLYDVVGPICESSDVLGRDRPFGSVKEHDLLAICDVGAYGFVMASRYNSHELPQELILTD